MSVDNVTGLILAGGRGTRMGGADKGLEILGGMPLAMHVLWRLAPQAQEVFVNANRNLGAYEGMGCTVIPDTIETSKGPLAGILTGLPSCETEWMMVVPCNAPQLPTNLISQLLTGIENKQSVAAIPCTTDPQGLAHTHPLFILIRSELYENLYDFIHSGGLDIEAWSTHLNCEKVKFDDHEAFTCINTVADLHAFSSKTKM